MLVTKKSWEELKRKVLQIPNLGDRLLAILEDKEESLIQALSQAQKLSKKKVAPPRLNLLPVVDNRLLSFQAQLLTKILPYISSIADCEICTDGNQKDRFVVRGAIRLSKEWRKTRRLMSIVRSEQSKTNFTIWDALAMLNHARERLPKNCVIPILRSSVRGQVDQYDPNDNLRYPVIFLEGEKVEIRPTKEIEYITGRIIYLRYESSTVDIFL